MDDGKVPLRADHHQDEDGRRVAERVHKLVHFAQEVSKHPAGKEKREGRRECLQLILEY